MFVEITQERIELISKIIRNDQKYPNNEDLFEDFLNETCRRSAGIIKEIEDTSTLEAYLKKVVSTSIVSVLKDSGRLRRAKNGYIPTTEVPIETVELSQNNISVPAGESASLFDFSTFTNGYDSVKVPVSPEENAIHNEIVDFIADTLERINKEEPDEKFMDIFILRYDKCLTQREMAEELGISQSEVSKRIYGLIERVKKVLDE